MRSLCLGLMLAVLAGGPSFAEDDKKNNTLPPKTESKLMRLESRVSAVERRWDKIDRKMKKMNEKIFGASKKKLLVTPKGPNVLTVIHDSQLGSIFRIMEIEYRLRSKAKAWRIFQAKRTSVTASLKASGKIYQKALKPGDYKIEVLARIQGYSPVLTYINSYKLRVSNGMAFRIRKGRPLSVRVVFTDRGGINVKKRIKITFKTLR